MRQWWITEECGQTIVKRRNTFLVNFLCPADSRFWCFRANKDFCPQNWLSNSWGNPHSKAHILGKCPITRVYSWFLPIFVHANPTSFDQGQFLSRSSASYSFKIPTASHVIALPLLSSWKVLVLITCTTQQTKKHAKIWKLKNLGNLLLVNRSSQMELPGRTESSRHGRPASSPLNSPIHMLSLEIQIHLQSLWLQHRSIHIR